MELFMNTFLRMDISLNRTKFDEMDFSEFEQDDL